MSLRRSMTAIVGSALVAAAFLSGAGPASAGIARTPVQASGGAGAAGGRHATTLTIGASTGLGLSYLPLTVMEKLKLLEKHAAALGLRATMRFEHFPKPDPMYDALVAGKLDLASGGVTQLLTSWNATRTDPDRRIKGVAALNAMPLDFMTSDPRIGTIADFTPKDRIAVPAVRTSIEAVVLAMATGEAFGRAKAGALDPLTVAMGHPEAVKALLYGGSAIDAHVASEPFATEERANPRVHQVFDSYRVLGGPHTYNLVWATTRFHDANPKLVQAFVAALDDAFVRIRADPEAAAKIYLETNKGSGLSVAQVAQVIRNPGNIWATAPKKIMAFARFMKQNGLIPVMPASTRDVFFPDVATQGGD